MTTTETNELEQRRMIAACAVNSAKGIEALVELLRVMTSMGLTPEQIVDAISSHLDLGVAEILRPLKEQILADYAWVFAGTDPGLAGMAGGISMVKAAMLDRHAPMRKLIDRLFSEAPKLENPDGTAVQGQAPALPEVAVHLASGHEMQGVLSMTPEGVFKMMSIASQGHHRIMLEQFFGIEDIDCVGLVRRAEPAQASLIVGGS